jgi:hypothetical protein
MTENVKHPEIEVNLSEEDGNALSIIARVSKALRQADIPDEEIRAFKTDAMSGNYDHLLQTCMKWVTVN